METEVEMVSITKGEYSRLLDYAKLLECLRAAGVDNCDVWSYALEMYNEEEKS